MSDDPDIEPYTGPAGGWGSVKSVESILLQEGVFVSGNAFSAQPPLTVQICSDTYTATNPEQAECVKLERL